MLKIEITDTETGEVFRYEAKFLMMQALDGSAGGVMSYVWGLANARDIAKCITAQDDSREAVFCQYPSVREAYALRSMLFDRGEQIDMSELVRRAMRGGGDE